MLKSLNFKRLVEKRVTKLLECLRLIGNLSNKNNYDYSDQEIDKIFKTIQNFVDEAKGKFKKNNKTINFKL